MNQEPSSIFGGPPLTLVHLTRDGQTGCYHYVVACLYARLAFRLFMPIAILGSIVDATGHSLGPN